MPIPLLPIDDRTYDDLVKEMRALIPRYAPEWTDHLPSDPGIMLLELFSWLTEMLIYRENRITDASRRQFVELLGSRLRPAQAARIELRVIATGLSKKLTLPANTPLIATKTGLEKPVPFEIVQDLDLVPELPISVVIARQSCRVSNEKLGVGSGKPNQVYSLGKPHVFYGDDSSRVDLKVRVGSNAAQWGYVQNLWDGLDGDEPENRFFTIDSHRNVVCFGAGEQENGIPPKQGKPIASKGKVPPAGAPIVISYHSTLGKNGNLPQDVRYEIDETSPCLEQAVRDALGNGVRLEFEFTREVSPGANPSTFDDVYGEIIRDLKAPWRTVTSGDFERAVLEHKGVNVARASCLPERDMESSTSRELAPGHVSIIIVPGRAPDHPSKPLATVHLPKTAADQDSNSNHLCRQTPAVGDRMAPWPKNGPDGCIQVSSDGRRIARIHRDLKSFQLWVEENGRQTVPLPETTPVTCVAFDPLGRYLAWASGDNIVRLWDVDDERLSGTPLFAGKRAVTSIAFSPDGRSLATGTRKGAVLLWNLETRQQLCPAIPILVRDPTKPQGWGHLTCDVLSVALSRDGRYLAFGTEDTEYTEHPQDKKKRASLIQLWDLQRCQPVHSIHTDAEGVPSLAFDPDSAYLAAAGGDGSVRVWDVRSFPPKYLDWERPRRHKGGTTSIAFAPDGTMLASAGKDGTIGLWDRSRLTEREPESHFIEFRNRNNKRVHVTSISFDPTGTTLAAGGDDGTLQLCNWKNWKQENPEFRPIISSDDPARPITSSDDPGSSITSSGVPGSSITSIAFSPRSASKAMVYGSRAGVWKLGVVEPDSKTPWKEETGRQSHGDRTLTAPARSSFSPDGRWLAVVADENAVQVWDMESQQQVAELTHGAIVRAVVFRPDGRWLVTSSDDHTTSVWEVETWGLVTRLEHEIPVVDLVFSADGRQFVILGEDGGIELWSSDRRQRMAAWRHERISGAVFSPRDGRWLATYGQTPALRIFDTSSQSWIDIDSDEQHQVIQPITQAVFRPDESHLVIRSEGGDFQCLKLDRNNLDWSLEWTFHPDVDPETVQHSPDLRWLIITTKEDPEHPQLWDLDNARIVAALHDDGDDVKRIVVFSEDGKLVATSSKPWLQVWEVQSGRQLAVLSPGDALDMAFVAGGSLLAAVDSSEARITVRVWRANYVQDTYEHLNDRRLITTRHHVIGASYQDVRVTAEVICQSRANQDDLKQRIKKNLQAFFDPVKGGPDSKQSGWPYGRDIYASELYQLIENTAGVDHVEALTLQTFKAPPSPDDSSQSNRSILWRLWRWEGADDNTISVAPNDLVHLLHRRDDIRLRSAR